jgi:outer membrane lipoprotein carrier protein
MMIRIATTAVLALAWAITAGSAGAVGPTAAECIDETIDALQRRYESIADFRADFVQTTRTVALAGAPGDDTARGTVVFAKPAKMRWAYTSPEPSLTVSDGETLWVYDPARAEVQRMSGIRGYFSGAITALTCTAESGELELVPRADASYEKLRILVDRATGELRRSTVIDLLGNVTQVEFSDVRANQQPDDGVFRFTPPDGVEVIDLDVR